MLSNQYFNIYSVYSHSKSHTMKRLTVLLLAAVLISSSVDAQCCKKGGHCTKACSKDKKAASNAAPAKATRADAPKRTS